MKLVYQCVNFFGIFKERATRAIRRAVTRVQPVFAERTWAAENLRIPNNAATCDCGWKAESLL